MKLLLLLLPACALAFFVTNAGLKDSRYGKLTAEEKDNLEKTWGIDLNARKARLNKIAKRTSLKPRSAVAEAKFQKRLKDIVPGNITKPTDEDDIVDLFEVNNRAGVSEYLFEGDIHLSEEQVTKLENDMSSGEENGNRQKRDAYTFANKWPQNTLYYYFDSSIGVKIRKSVRTALSYLRDHTCINFVENRTATNRVKVYSGQGCNSAVGMQKGEQLLSLGDGCEIMGTIAHQFTHALGFLHTQSRSDRDTYVDVDLSHVPEQYQGNFNEELPYENLLYTPYDYGSFMHLSANAFTSKNNSLSILPKDTNFTYTIGNRLISFYDLQMINDYYSCDAACTVSNSAKCENGGYPNPRQCAVCNCPRGYGGRRCNERPPGCGKTLAATQKWQSYKIKVGDDKDYGSKSSEHTPSDVFRTCTHWITAPQGKQIQVSITKMDNSKCDYGCNYNGIEIKANSDQKITNPLFCCQEFRNRIITSSLNPIPVISFSRMYESKFGIEYRFVAKITPSTKKTTKAPSGTTTAPIVSSTRSNQISTLPLKRLFNKRLAKDHFHSNTTVMQLWIAQGYQELETIGNVIDPEIGRQTLEAVCPSAVKLRAFVSIPGVEFMTIKDEEALKVLNDGWLELPTVGYCSSVEACGAAKNLRSVISDDNQNIVYSTNDADLYFLNQTSPYAGSLTPTICWLF